MEQNTFIMTESEVLRILLAHFESLFPKDCSVCKRRFPTLREYIQITKRIGPTISYDAELGRWTTSKPLGTMALANCPCGSTLSLSTGSMPLPLRQELLKWLKTETRMRGISSSELLDYLRDKVRNEALGGKSPNDS